MSAARHFTQPGDLSTEALREDIKRDIKAAQGSAQDLKAAGQEGPAERMREATDGYLDEYNEVNNGTWSPQHSS